MGVVEAAKRLRVSVAVFLKMPVLIRTPGPTRPRHPRDANRVREPVAKFQRLAKAKGYYHGKAHGKFDKSTHQAANLIARLANIGYIGVLTPGVWNALVALPDESWRPRIIDGRDGRNGMARHPQKRYGTRPVSRLLGLCGHYSASDGMNARDLAAYHVNSSRLSPSGAPGIAYGLVVEKNGDLVVGHSAHVHTWHAKGANERWAAIVYCGLGPMTPEQYRTVGWVLENGPNGALAEYGWPAEAFKTRVLSTHQHFMATACPGPGEPQYRRLAAEHGWRFDPNPATR